MDLHEAQKGGGAPIGSPHEINNLKQQLQDTKRKLEAAEKQVDEKTQAVNELENKLKVCLWQKWIQFSDLKGKFFYISRCVLQIFCNLLLRYENWDHNYFASRFY